MEILPATDADLDEVVALFRSARFALQERRWLEWKYFRNPAGPASAFKIVEQGALAGAVALVPRDFFVNGERIVGLQAVDGLMGPAIRGRGLFNEVMHFLREQRPVPSVDRYFFLSFPSLASSIKAHENAGWHRLANFELYTVPLTARFFERVAGMSWAAPMLAPAWWAFRTVGLRRIEAQSTSVSTLVRFSDDLNWYFPRDLVHGDRSARFMNWRVFDNPQAQLCAYRIAEEGREVGYAVGQLKGRTLELVDVKLQNRRQMSALLGHIAAEDRVDSVDYWLLLPPGYVSFLPRFLTFRRRFSGALFVDRIVQCGLPTVPSGWDISYIDSDW